MWRQTYKLFLRCANCQRYEYFRLPKGVAFVDGTLLKCPNCKVCVVGGVVDIQYGSALRYTVRSNNARAT